jgi:hypothetical protein
VLTTEDLADPQSADASMRRVEAYLGLPECHDTSILGRRFNRAPAATMDPSLRAELAELYRPYNERLQDHLGRKLDWC